LTSNKTIKYFLNKQFNMNFTSEEIRDLTISMFGLALILSYPEIKEMFVIYLGIVFFSYIFRELAHKFVAKRFGCMATFKLWPAGILLGLVTMFLKLSLGGIVFLAPGYVEIMPYTFGKWGLKVIRLTPRDLGIISLAAIGVNLFLMISFTTLFSLYPQPLFKTMAMLNGLITIFNLLPIPHLDGGKIYTWDMKIWTFLIFITILTFAIM